MSSPKQLLVSCVSLLCMEHRNGVATSPSTELIKNVVMTLPLGDGTIDLDHGRQTYLELKKFTLLLNNLQPDEFPSESEVLQQLQVVCREETYLYEAVANLLFEPVGNINELIRKIHSYRRNLQSYLNDKQIQDILKEYHHKLAFKPGSVTDVVGLVTEMGSKLDPLVSAKAKQRHPAMMGSMDFSDTESVVENMASVKQTLSTDGAFRTGWKSVNRMLGKVGAIKRGEFGIIGGLQHNFKSGFMLSLFVHFCLFNRPFLRDKARKPLIVFITFENEIPDNLLWIYKYLKENETGQPVIDSEIDINEAADYVAARLRETGFEIKMERFDPTDFTASGFTAFLDGLMAEGYEVQMLIIDYLNMLSKSGLDAKVAGDDIRLLFRKVRNYTAPRGIACLTPHQLSTDALQMTRDGTSDLVKAIANKGYYDGCRRLGQEPDLEVSIHIVRVNGKAFLTMARGKHRNTVTPEKDQYVCLPFKDVGTIPWDIDGDEDISVRQPGANSMFDDNEDMWDMPMAA